MTKLLQQATRNNVIFFLLFCVCHSLRAQDVYPFWTKVITGKGNVTSYDIAVNSAGDVYTTGSFVDTIDFDPGAGVMELFTPFTPSSDMFVSKLDATGNYSNAYPMGGTGSGDVCTSIVIDENDNVFYAGYFYDSADFNPAPNDSFNLYSAGQTDIFTSKSDASDNFAWAKKLGAGNQQSTADIALDASGNIYSTGLWVNDLFIFKANPQGDTLWTRRYPALNQVNPGYAVTTDDQSNLYVTGYYWGMSILQNNNTPNIFIMKFDSAGTQLWAKGIGGTQWDFGLDVVVDDSGNVYTTGYFTDRVDFNPSTAASDTFFLKANGGRDAFVVKLDAGGNFLWAKNFGGRGNDSGDEIIRDPSGNFFLTGSFTDTITVGTTTLIALGGTDAFLAKMDVNGNFTWVKHLGGSGTEAIRGIILDASENIYLTGYFNDTIDLDLEAGVSNFVTAGSNATFIIKLSQQPITDIGQTVISDNFFVYPNPSHDVLNVVLDEKHPFVSVEVIHINGQKLAEEKLNTQTRFSLTTSTYPAGIYLLKLQTAKGEMAVKRFVKE